MPQTIIQPEEKELELLLFAGFGIPKTPQTLIKTLGKPRETNAFHGVFGIRNAPNPYKPPRELMETIAFRGLWDTPTYKALQKHGKSSQLMKSLRFIDSMVPMSQ